MRDGVIIVLQRGSRFLVGERAAHKPAPGYWTQVAGKVEPGESQPDAVIREAMEEIGCKVQPLEKLQERPSLHGQFRLHYWRTDILEGEPSICNDELEELRWVTLEELLLLEPIFQEDVELFEELLAEV